MANKETLLAEAAARNIEVPEDATKAQIQVLLEDVAADVTAPEGTGEVPAIESDTETVSSPEEVAAADAGVPKERLNDPKQNREPKNDFEQENQEATETERQAAQKASDVSTEDKIENAPTPVETAASDSQATAAVIAQAITEGLKDIKDEKFELQAEPGINHRFTVVRNKQTGEVMLRENETGALSRVQLESLEEKEKSVQETEVEEL